MDGQPTAVHIVGLFAQKIEKLGVGHAYEKIKTVVGVAHDEKHGRLAVSQGVQLQFVIGSQLPQLLNIKGSQSRTAAHQDRLRGFACRKGIFSILADSEVVRVAFFQFIKHQIHGIFEVLIILPYLHGVDKLDESGKILLVLRGLIMNVANERSIEQRLGLDPKIVPGLALAFGVGNQRRDQLQNVLFTVNVGKGIVVHRLFEVDGVEDFEAIVVTEQKVSTFDHDAAFRIGDHEAGGIGF